MNFEDWREFDDRFKELEKKVQKISNTLLNIHFNSDLFLKVMKMEQRKIEINQEINKLISKDLTIDGELAMQAGRLNDLVQRTDIINGDFIAPKGYNALVIKMTELEKSSTFWHETFNNKHKELEKMLENINSVDDNRWAIMVERIEKLEKQMIPNPLKLIEQFNNLEKEISKLGEKITAYKHNHNIRIEKLDNKDDSILEIQKKFRESPCPHNNIDQYGLCLECGRNIKDEK